MFQPHQKQKETKYFLFKNDYHSGPFEKERIREMLIESIVNENDIVCAEGDEEWIPIKQILKTDNNIEHFKADSVRTVTGDTFYILVENETRGPYTLNQLKTMWNIGSVTVRTMFMAESAAEWTPLRNILHRLETPQANFQSTDNLPPILQTSTRKVQTIEATSKTWKGLLLFSVLLIIAGFLTLFNSAAYGCSMIFLGFVTFLFARIGSWWSHG
jgi:hypothetical protein